jgi:hypothetical protein
MLYRFDKHDEQLCKTLDQLFESGVDFFQWQSSCSTPDENLKLTAFCGFLAFIDRLGCYFSQVGIPGKYISATLKIARLQNPEIRYTAAVGHAWQAQSLQGSAPVWKTLKPALRVMLESAWASSKVLPGEDTTGRARKRTKRSLHSCV